ncbi:FAD/NAD(P)-binding oxidoreductase family protein [Rhynchospora pubera]|uniref:FAD/NAD(P)-binding oxidoreductase family protein n=1 Tax=Rhynchospora pubera TaxID=906938 RepID=A0AAV8FDE5_9POAL|nr:FAD/NAD(P)-binding oxidoreductase family protein [Rhynchospora pubera]
MIIQEEIVIVGGGIAGLATALALKRVGFQARVLEQNPELRAGGSALTLAPNAWFALRALGIDDKLKPLYQPIQESLVTNLDSGAIQEAKFAGTQDNRENAGVRSVHRKVLLEALAEELPPDAIRFSSKLISIKSETLQDSSKVTVLHLEDGTVIQAKVVIGCDGVHSAVAQWLGLSQPLNSGRWAVRGLAVYPEGHGLDHGVKQYLSGGTRAGALTINSKEIYWFVVTYSSLEKDISTNPELLLEEVSKNLAKGFPSEFLNVVKHTDRSSLSWVPLLFRAPWNIAFGNAYSGGVTVAGDAMHPMTPDLGQGGCSALEDAVILARCISQAHLTAATDRHWLEKALKRYVEARRWRVTWLVAGAWFAGWVQQGGGGGQEWWSVLARWFRDRFYYPFILPRTRNLISGDCGDLILSDKRD